MPASWSGVGGGVGAEAGEETEGQDEKDAAYCADSAEYAGAFESTEEATDNCSGQGSCTGDQVSDFNSKEAQWDDEQSCERAGYQADGGNGCGRARYLGGAADDET